MRLSTIVRFARGLGELGAGETVEADGCLLVAPAHELAQCLFGVGPTVGTGSSSQERLEIWRR
jgi:hypothetical protein